MVVNITTALKTELKADGLDSRLLCQSFKEWKTSDEFGSYHFGKDSAYAMPTVDGQKYALRHVHLVPVLDQLQRSAWNKAWKLRGRKTSDRVLVYTQNSRGNFLLIFILSEPDAHEIARMRNPKHKSIMDGFANVAAAFLFDGSIIA